MQTGTVNIAGKEYKYGPMLNADDGGSFCSSGGKEGYDGNEWCVFRSDIDWQYQTSWYSTWLAPMPQWIGYDYQRKTTLSGVLIYIDDYNIPASHPVDFSIQGWDGADWVIIKSIVDARWYARTPNVYWFDKPASYAKYRLYVTKNTGGSATFHRVRFILSPFRYLLMGEDYSVHIMKDSALAKIADDWRTQTDAEKQALFKQGITDISMGGGLKKLGGFKILVFER